MRLRHAISFMELQGAAPATASSQQGWATQPREKKGGGCRPEGHASEEKKGGTAQPSSLGRCTKKGQAEPGRSCHAPGTALARHDVLQRCP